MLDISSGMGSNFHPFGGRIICFDISSGMGSNFHPTCEKHIRF
jgi:hypothetical protein